MASTPDPSARLLDSTLLMQLAHVVDRIDALTARLRDDRTRMILRSVAVWVEHDFPDAATFTLKPAADNAALWHLGDLTDSEGAIINPGMQLQAEVNSLLQSGAFTPAPHLMPTEATVSFTSAWQIPLTGSWLQEGPVRPSVIDIDELSEDDFTLVLRAARDRLAMTGFVRTRADFEAYFEEEAYAGGYEAPANLVQVATETAIRRYQDTLPREDDTMEATVFDRVNAEVADFLGMNDDTSHVRDRLTPHPPHHEL